MREIEQFRLAETPRLETMSRAIQPAAAQGPTMGRTDNYDFVSSASLPRIATWLQMKKEGGFNGKRLKQLTLEGMSADAAMRLGLPERTRISRTRFAKILACRHGMIAGVERANAVQKHEIEILAAMFDCSVKEIIGVETPPEVITRDAPLAPHERAEFKERYDWHLRNCGAGAVLGWGECLPCSLEPPKFMHGHHESLFTDLYKEPDLLQRVVAQYDGIGMQRREEFLRDGIRRSYRFAATIFEADLEKIALRSAPEYARCSAAMRRECLTELCTTVTRREWKVDLHIIGKDVSRSDMNTLRRRVHDFDVYVVIVDEVGRPTFAFWRNHLGDLSWTEEPSRLKLRSDTMIELQGAANYRSDVSCTKVVAILKRLIQRAGQKSSDIST